MCGGVVDHLDKAGELAYRSNVHINLPPNTPSYTEFTKEIA